MLLLTNSIIFHVFLLIVMSNLAIMLEFVLLKNTKNQHNHFQEVTQCHITLLLLLML